MLPLPGRVRDYGLDLFVAQIPPNPASGQGRRLQEIFLSEPANLSSSADERAAELEAEIARLRRSLDEAVRRTVDDVPAARFDYEREAADLRAALALQQARVTEAEQTVARLVAERAQLVASEARYRLAVESANDYAILTVDLSGRITGWNVGAQNLMGWAEDEMLGEPANVIFMDLPRESGELFS